MAAVILPFSSGPGRQDEVPAPQPGAPAQGRTTLDLDGGASPLRGGSFAPAAPARRVPAEAILAIGRRICRAAALPDEPAPQAGAPRRMPRKHKLMLLTAAAVLYTGGMEARRTFKPRAVMIEAPISRAHDIAALPLQRPAA
ncbi:hypothetical protein [Methylobacterium aquaticum]|uniref:hypothetical protein n=1 Tax=Methylobacterium aquaticum TaxID=270351 RepID=UPI00193301EF|nr:hypothetical protein [Methylobacterium aquaticum]QRE77320.1 hypothetical protein F1D61_30735 [Methylobacterium aquaticum]